MSIDKKLTDEDYVNLMLSVNQFAIDEELSEDAIRNNGDWPQRDRLLMDRDDEDLTGG